MISKIRSASITVTDIEKAKEFYTQILGFRVVVEMPLPGNIHFVMVAPKDGGSNLVFSLPLPARHIHRHPGY